MIRMHSVNKSFGRELVLKSVSCHIERYTPTVLLGPSGAGKSTLLRCINGLVDIDSGQIIVDNIPLPRHPKKLRKFRKSIGMIFQQFNLIKNISVLENVLCGRLAYTPVLSSLLTKFTNPDYEIACYYLAKVGLYDKRYQKAGQLSGGQQQRIAIARALVQQPKILLADEPVASLDPKTATAILDLLTKIHEEEKITLVLTLHAVDLAIKYARKIIGINRGQIIAQYDTDKVNAAEIYSVYDNCDNSDSYPECG
ncbi:MAG TPA: phosphonate ABC transporter ATP-binding protein [Methylomusa anaerophila]|uniref:Glutamine transport ATP-binding protein GlnQ n=1 Tax=Methylomusa anaerophila TaxID=1930071 RepID=A0A348AGR7_9FIRM|nr:phosphonate ABC transporter ATP-binding protein [Methylomusa anaerophila]BBB90265.1 glutamine transport ATP-binding protein GlnQ [Methylomusa anaerophila]HML89389.1 phosphonate ABC transporter ATP-binding protein [Methylomusa anaerophila]